MTMGARIGRPLASRAFLLLLLLVTPPAMAQVPPDEEIRRIIADRIDVYRRSVGMVVGVIEPGGTRIVAHGRTSSTDALTPDGDTLFEVASITKVFTSLLLAEMARRGEVALDDPVAAYLPSEAKVPERGRAITLRDLSTHVSGLPRFIEDFEPRDDRNPYEDVTIDRLYAFLASHALRREVGTKYEYSNLGAALLGQALALKAGGDYEDVLRQRVLDPLSLSSTRVTLTAEMRSRLAPGHTEMLAQTSGWDQPIKGAGALHSSAKDLLSLLAVALGYRDSSLAPAIDDMLQPANRIGPVPRALGWQTFTRSGREIVWHNGSSGGYRTFIGLVRSQRIGIVVLSNAVNSIEDIGFHLLDATWSLLRLKPPEERKSVDVAPEILQRYVGRYEFMSSVAHVDIQDGRLFIRLPWRQPIELFAVNQRSFFARESWREFSFVVTSNGTVIAMQTRLPDQTIVGARLD